MLGQFFLVATGKVSPVADRSVLLNFRAQSCKFLERDFHSGFTQRQVQGWVLHADQVKYGLRRPLRVAGLLARSLKGFGYV